MGRWDWRDLGARPLFFPAVGLGVGVVVGGATPGRPGIFLGISAVLLCLAGGLGRRTGAHLLLLLGTASTGAALARWQATPLVPPAMRTGGSFHLEGSLEGLAPEAQGAAMVLAVSRVAELAHERARFRVKLRAYGSPAPWTRGERVLVRAALHPVEPALNWGEPDGAELLRRQGVAFVGSTDAAAVVALAPPDAVELWLAARRDALGREARRLAPSPEAAAFYATLAAGLRSELGDAWEARFSESGLAHVLSVSGLHVAALAVLTLALLRWALVRLWVGRRTWDARRPAALFAIPALWAYVVFTGDQPPAVRSALMASVMFVGLALWRRSDALNSLALAAGVLLVEDPACVADVSLQLSFLAVLSLIVLSPAVRASLPVPPPEPGGASGLLRLLLKAREAALQAFSASVAVTAAGLPVVAQTFHRASLAGLVSNIVCLPLTGLLTAATAGGAACFVASPRLAIPLVWLGTRLCAVFLHLVAFFASAPGASIGVPALAPWATAAHAVGLLAFAHARGRVRWAWVLTPLALLSLALPSLRPPEGLTVTFLSVGHGDAVLLESAGSAALVDGGGVPGGADPGRRVVVPYLRERGIHALELAVLSHPHPDHALGLVSALGAVPTRRLWLPLGNDDGPLTRALREAAHGAHIEEVEAGHAPFRLGEAELRVLGPPRDRILLEGVNDRSTVLWVRHGDVSFLLTGDIQAAGEEALDAPGVTVLKAPHHGSSTSSTPGFVARVRPRFVVFCVGRHSRFHFPSPEVVRRYEAAGTRCLRTDLDGAVRFTSDGHTVRLETFLSPGHGRPADPVDTAEADAQVTRDDSGRSGPRAADGASQGGAQAGRAGGVPARQGAHARRARPPGALLGAGGRGAD